MKKQNSSARLKALKSDGALNPKADRVKDALFLEHQDFFDPNDLPQVKYEMLRGVKKEGKSISTAARAFGFSRLSFYRIRSAFEKQGLVGLTSQKRGPREAHKLSDEVMEFIQSLESSSEKNTSDLKSAIQEKFKFSIHKRSIERALSRRKKGNKMTSIGCIQKLNLGWVTWYEQLRLEVLNPSNVVNSQGMAIFKNRGLLGWERIISEMAFTTDILGFAGNAESLNDTIILTDEVQSNLVQTLATLIASQIQGVGHESRA